MCEFFSDHIILTCIFFYSVLYFPLCALSDALDVNDNVPFFTSSIYEASVTEGAGIGTFVIQVSATDLDLGQNGEVSKWGSMFYVMKCTVT